MSPLRRLGLAAVLAAGLTLPAAAQDSPAGYAGQWTISGVTEGAEVCTITLGEEAAIGGWSIEVPQDCIDRLGVPPDVAAWTVYPDGAIGLIDPLRKVLLKFAPTEIGGYVAEPEGGEPLALDQADGR
jgi:hypothetical protein